ADPRGGPLRRRRRFHGPGLRGRAPEGAIGAMTETDRDEGFGPPHTEDILRELFEMVENARNLPMSTSVRIEREEALDLIEAAIDRLPEELRAARWLLKGRDDFRARTAREAQDVIDTATETAARMVART